MQKQKVLLNPPTNRPPTTYPPTHRLPSHRPTDAVITFKRFENSKMFTFTEHKHSWKNVKRSSVYYLENL